MQRAQDIQNKRRNILWRFRNISANNVRYLRHGKFSFLYDAYRCVSACTV